MSPLTCLFPQPKARKLRSKGRGKADLLKKSLEDKIHLFEERAPEDLADKVGLSSGCLQHAELKEQRPPIATQSAGHEVPSLPHEAHS